MEAIIPFLVIGVIVAVIVTIIVFSIVSDRKRKEGLQSAADEMGLTFYPDGDEVLFDGLSRFNLFNQGRGRKMTNLIQGDSGEVKIAIFDYKYTTGSGKNSTTHRMSIASLQSTELNCPEFSMRPENFLDRIGGALGFQDIDFESHPNFSGKFVLKGSNEEAVRAFFTPALLEFFETQAGVSLEAEPGSMFFYRPRKRIKPDELKDLLGSAYEVFGHMVDQK